MDVSIAVTSRPTTDECKSLQINALVLSFDAFFSTGDVLSTDAKEDGLPGQNPTHWGQQVRHSAQFLGSGSSTCAIRFVSEN